jgi:serine/threonine protein kinase
MTPRPITSKKNPVPRWNITIENKEDMFTGLQRLQQRYLMTTTVLGSGKFGKVMLAKCLRTGNKVAVKTINKRRLKPKQQNTLHKEIEIMQTISHKDIVALLDFFEDSEELHIVLEYCDGCDLFDRIVQRGRYLEVHARPALHSMLRSLNYLHRQDICHRDIKPENFVTNKHSEDVKLIDFGLSKVMERGDGRSLQRMTSRVGTPYYIAPELLVGEEYDTAVDMWSLGVVFYIMVGGYPPFNGSTDREIFKKIKKGELDLSDPAFRKATPAAISILCAMLHRDPAKRITAEEALAHPFFDSLVASPPPINPHKVKIVADKPTGSETSSSIISEQSVEASLVNASQDPASPPVPAVHINKEVYNLPLDVKTVHKKPTCKQKTGEQTAIVLSKLKAAKGVLLNVMEQAHATQFGQLFASRCHMGP